TGDLGIGDRVPEVPTTAGMASLTWEGTRVRATAGASFVGRWTGYDWLTFYGHEMGGGPMRPEMRSYWVEYPSITKPFVGVSYALARGAEWYLRVDNLTNVQQNERDNLQVTQGRTASFGLRLSR
ncbi:MAG TPA: hypothetical protein VFV33_10205, partial [Gemmatimonadaceae bacterium]|nr:hypothetical protein [Gemmatimonadaceae bacterium]